MSSLADILERRARLVAEAEAQRRALGEQQLGQHVQGGHVDVGRRERGRVVALEQHRQRRARDLLRRPAAHVNFIDRQLALVDHAHAVVGPLNGFDQKELLNSVVSQFDSETLPLLTRRGDPFVHINPNHHPTFPTLVSAIPFPFPFRDP